MYGNFHMELTGIGQCIVQPKQLYSYVANMLINQLKYYAGTES